MSRMPERSNIGPVAAWASGCIILDASVISGSWSLQDEQAGVMDFHCARLFFKKFYKSGGTIDRDLKGNGHDDCCHLRCVDISELDWASDCHRHGIDGGDLFYRTGGDKRFVHAPGENVLQHDSFHPPCHPFFYPDGQLDEFRRHHAAVVSICP